MAGRPPKPTALKKLAGNPGKRSLNGAEPKPPAKRPPCPKHLQDEARREWNRMAKQLFELDLLTGVDRAALAAYCQAWADWVSANNCLRIEGMVTQTENGYPVLSPYWTIANQAAKTMKSFLIEFGMSPGSRSRLRVGQDEKRLSVSELLDAAVNGNG